MESASTLESSNLHIIYLPVCFVGFVEEAWRAFVGVKNTLLDFFLLPLDGLFQICCCIFRGYSVDVHTGALLEAGPDG